MVDEAAAQQPAEPRASRPRSPEGYWRPRPLPWSWARQRLIDARNYWIVSVLPDGRPHARPVWGVWLAEQLYFDTGSRIGRNLLANPELTVHLESGDEVVILEGTAERILDPERGRRFAAAYGPKYHELISEPPGALFVVHPRVAFGWVSDPTGLDGPGAIFGSTGTRWDFESENAGARSRP